MTKRAAGIPLRRRVSSRPTAGVALQQRLMSFETAEGQHAQSYQAFERRIGARRSAAEIDIARRDASPLI